MKNPVAKKRKKGNPATSSERAYQSFHGRPSEKTVTVVQEIHYHKHLAACGKLEKLEVAARSGKVILSNFKGALLCVNEAGTQLFIRGGDQKVAVQDFGVKVEHENEDLGEVKAIEYFTTKDHLGDEGGTAVYRHKFSKPYPRLQYDTRNQLLSFSGGRYVILPEGIDQ